MRRIKFFGRTIPVPRNPVVRVGLGILCLVGGLLGFLPILGVWMFPLGLLILSIDFPPVRRFQRLVTVRLGNWLHHRWPSLAAKMGARRQRKAASKLNQN